MRWSAVGRGGGGGAAPGEQAVLLPNRRDLPRMYQKLMYVLAGSNNLAEYRQILWKGVASLHARGALRDVFVDQIVKTYRGVCGAPVRGEAPLVHRRVLLPGNAARQMATSPRWRRCACICRCTVCIPPACIYSIACSSCAWRPPGRKDRQAPVRRACCIGLQRVGRSPSRCQRAACW